MAIQFLRGSGHSSTSTLAVGQPYYDTANSLLFMGVGSTSTLAELNSITYSASRWLQTGYTAIAVTSTGTTSACMSLQFFTDTVYDASTFSSDFGVDHLYEAVNASGCFYNDGDCCSIILVYNTTYGNSTSYSIRYYYTYSDRYSTTVSSSYYVTANLTFVPIAAKKVTSN